MSPLHVARTSLRRLRRRAGFSGFAIALLGLGIGVVAASWTVLERTVLEPLPVRDQDEVVVAWVDHLARGFDHFPITVPLYEALESEGLPALSGVAAVASAGAGRGVVDGAEGPWTVAWSSVLGDFFGVLGVDAALGRSLQRSDDVPGAAERVIVISHDLWTGRFGGSGEVVGRVLQTRTGSWTIVGVLPESFDYPRGTDIWAPTRAAYPAWESERPPLELELIGRTTDEATPELVAQQLAAASTATPDFEEVYAGSVPVVRPLDEVVLGDLDAIVLLLFLGTVLVLLVAGLDLGTMMLVRTVDDDRGIGVRRALGASPRALLAEAVGEALALGLLAIAVGLALGWACLRLLVPLVPEALPRIDQVGGLDPAAAAGASALGLVVVVAAVLLPRYAAIAGRSAAPGLSGLRVTSGRGAERARSVLVASQVGLAVWVLACGGLLARTATNLQRLDPGFAPDALSVVALDHGDSSPLSPPGATDRLRAAAARLATRPGVTGATPVQMRSLPGAGAWQTILYKEGQTPEQGLAENVYLFMEFIEPGYLDLMEVPLLRGRGFDASDRGAPLVAMVNEAAARRYWPGQSALGQRVSTGLPGADGADITVVGVVGDTRYGALETFQPAVYFSLDQLDGFRSQYLLVRTDGSDVALMDEAREALSAEAPGVRPTGVERVGERMAEPLAAPRFSALLATLLAVTALAIALWGVYAVMAFVVRSRRREIGVRMACGGTPRSVGVRIVRHGVGLAAIGALFGVAAAAWSSRALEALLFDVAPGDPLSLAGGAAIALATALLASALPALHAARVDPATALRSEG